MAEQNPTPEGEPPPSTERGPDLPPEAVAVPADRDARDDGPVTTERIPSGTRPAAQAAPATAAVPPPPAEQPVLEPAHDGPAAPAKGGNRLVGTAWVLLAAGLFELLLFAAVALLALLLGAPPSAVPAQLGQIASSPFAWLPVLLFFLLFELTVLLFNRAGRFAYVVASLVVGLLVYGLSVALVLILSNGSLGDLPTVARAAVTPLFVLTGLVAREVMLWTGFAIGARGKRVRVRYRTARDAYRQELAERADTSA